MLRLNGITPVMVTTFREDESIDDEALRHQIDYSIEGGAVAVCGPGYAGEFYKLSDKERYHWVDVLIEHTNKRVPAIAATSSGSTQSTIEFSRHAEKMGADCLMVNAPRTSPLQASEMIGFYSRLCDAVSIPVMLQDADFNGSGLPAKVFIELAQKHQNFLFAKLEVLIARSKIRGDHRADQGPGSDYLWPGRDCDDGRLGTWRFRRHVRVSLPGRLRSRLRTLQTGPKGRSQSFVLQAGSLPGVCHATSGGGGALEKRVFVRRGILPTARMRQPSLVLDAIYQEQIEDIVTMVVELCHECREKSAATV